ncbi:MAG: NPCBM/NEW2 domain-containing protein [Phycisphaerae bacterium]
MNPSTPPQPAWALTLALLAVTAGLCRPVAGASASEFNVTVRTTTADSIKGTLVEFSLPNGLVIQSDPDLTPQTFDTVDVVEIVADNPAVEVSAEGVRLDLLGGDLLTGRVIGFADQNAELQTQFLGTVPVPLDSIRVLTTPAAENAGHRLAVAKLLHRRAGADDALLLTNGDIVQGLITAIDGQDFAIETPGGDLRIRADRVAAAVLMPLGQSIGPMPRVRIHTTDGQRLTASQFHWSGFSALAVVLDQAKVRISGDRIARLAVIGGRWQWITALEPISYEHTPALGLPWTWEADRNVVGSPIKVAGRQYEHGLGVHGQSSITFDLKGTYAEFVTYLGLDDDTGPFANVDVEIRVDGQLRYDTQGITPGALLGPVRLDVSGARRIKLSVLLGANADIQDRFNWVRTALIRR